MASRETLALDLTIYGEDEIAAHVVTVCDVELTRILGRASHYVFDVRYAVASGDSPLLGRALAMAAVEVVEGQQRALQPKRRRLKGAWTGA